VRRRCGTHRPHNHDEKRTRDTRTTIDEAAMKSAIDCASRRKIDGSNATIDRRPRPPQPAGERDEAGVSCT